MWPLAILSILTVAVVDREDLSGSQLEVIQARS
jgi:hypothetical protein